MCASPDELAGVSRVYLGTIERSKTACSIDIVDQFARALDVAVPDLSDTGFSSVALGPCTAYGFYGRPFRRHMKSIPAPMRP